MRRLVGFLLGTASLLMGGASLHILIPMCLKILYALFVSRGSRATAVLRFCRALVSSRISLMTTMASAEAFLRPRCRASASRWTSLALGGTPVVLSSNEVLIVVGHYPHWSTLQVLL